MQLAALMDFLGTTLLSQPIEMPRSLEKSTGLGSTRLELEIDSAHDRASLEAQMVKNLPEMQELQETQVLSLGQEDPLEEGMATHSSILAWKIPWLEEPGRLQPMELQRVGHD